MHVIRQAFLILFGFALAGGGNPAVAADFFPMNGTELQDDLSEAAGNGSDDNIFLGEITYRTSEIGNSPFTYNSTEANNLTVTGAGIGKSILDGGSGPAGGQVISLETTGAGASISVQGVTVQNGFNGPGDGTGLLLEADQDATLMDSEISGNQTDGEVVALRLFAFTGTATLINNRIHDNFAGQLGIISVNSGGAGGALVEGNEFFNNETEELSAFSVQTSEGDLIFNNNTVFGNQATNGDRGGCVLVANEGSIIFTNNIVYDNSATGDTGGCSLASQSGAIFAVNNTITHNTAGSGSGGLILNVNLTSATNVFNNIVFGNTGAPGAGQDIFVDDIFAVGATVLLFNNLFTEFCVDSGTCDPTDLGPDQGDNIIDQDPLFFDPANGDFRLSVGSPAIDQGDLDPPGGLPNPDHAGITRPFGSAPDMGALEAAPTLATNPAALNFGQISSSQSDPLELTILNNGGVEANVSGLALSDGSNYQLDVNGGADPCGSQSFVIPGLGSCTVTVTFTPTGDNTFDATLTISSDDPDNPQLIVNLTGVKAGGGGCALNPESQQPFFAAWLWTAALLVGIVCFRLRILIFSPNPPGGPWVGSNLESGSRGP
jgi:hypothetical protein